VAEMTQGDAYYLCMAFSHIPHGRDWKFFARLKIRFDIYVVQSLASPSYHTTKHVHPTNSTDNQQKTVNVFIPLQKKEQRL
jgi:hypothetical protein